MDISLHLQSYIDKYHYKYLALYHALREAIAEGRLPGGMKLPSTRELANQYGLSRGSVAQSYDMLLAEGYVFAEAGRGTFVAYAGYSPTPIAPEDQSVIRLSEWGKRMLELPSVPAREAIALNILISGTGA